MVECLNCIYECSEARNYAEYPLSIRTPLDKEEGYKMVFRYLTTLGYKIGAPNRNENEQLYNAFVNALILL